MKALPLLLLLLTGYLLGVVTQVHGRSLLDHGLLQRQNVTSAQPGAASNMQAIVLKSDHNEEEKIDLVTDEEDENLTQKLVSLAKSFAAFFFYLFVLSYVFSWVQKVFSSCYFFPFLSRKFISQRVLRI